MRPSLEAWIPKNCPPDWLCVARSFVVMSNALNGVIEAGMRGRHRLLPQTVRHVLTVSGANAIIVLRCCRLNNRMEDYREVRRAAQLPLSCCALNAIVDSRMRQATLFGRFNPRCHIRIQESGEVREQVDHHGDQRKRAHRGDLQPEFDVQFAGFGL